MFTRLLVLLAVLAVALGFRTFSESRVRSCRLNVSTINNLLDCQMHQNMHIFFICGVVAGESAVSANRRAKKFFTIRQNSGRILAKYAEQALISATDRA